MGGKTRLTALVRAARAFQSFDHLGVYQHRVDQLLAQRKEDELAALFGTPLRFGTAGLRGVVGPGFARMNDAMVRLTSEAVAMRVLAEEVVHPWPMVIGYDGRRDSKQFAHTAAEAFEGYGAYVHLFEEPAPTPMVAFAVTDLGAACGVAITASHNPPEYNGYKLFWSHGSQITAPLDAEIAAIMDGLIAGNIARLRTPVPGNTLAIDDALALRYRGRINEFLWSDPDHRSSHAIAYTAMHGVGGRAVVRALEAQRFAVVPVAAQFEPDGTFPTVKFPNPEEPGALELLAETMEQSGANIGLANDPDADRLAVMVRHDEQLMTLTGDEVGVLLAEHLLAHGKRGILITTVVSSELLSEMAKHYDVPFAKTLTGFKWIAKAARELETSTGQPFLFGYEEALGYCVGGVVRDKDGVGAALAFADLYCDLVKQGLTPVDKLKEIAMRHGVFSTSQVSLMFDGPNGQKRMRTVMEALRTKTLQIIGQEPRVRDLQDDPEFPSSNVLMFELENMSRIIVRPSGTEPKLKSYFQAWASPDRGLRLAQQSASKRRQELEQAWTTILASVS